MSNAEAFLLGVFLLAALLVAYWSDRRRQRRRIIEAWEAIPPGPSIDEAMAEIEGPLVEKVTERQAVMGSAWAQMLELSTPEGQRAAARRQAARPFYELSEREQDQRIEHHMATRRRLAKARREGSLARW